MTQREGRRVIDAIGANMILRIGSFVMSMLLTRLSTPESRGMSFQAEVVTNSVGFIAREALRCLYPTFAKSIRSGDSPRKKQREVGKLISLALFVVPFALLAMLLLEVVTFVLPVPSVSRLEFVASSPSALPLICWMSGLLLEWASEPFVAMAVASQSFKVRVITEALALAVAKGASVAAISAIPLVTSQPSYLVGLQQLTYGLVTVLTLYLQVFVRADPKETPPADCVSLFEMQRLCRGLLAEGRDLSVSLSIAELRAQFGAWRSYFTETFLRLILTEGEKYILASYVAISGQGVFDVVNTIGSLVARLVFKVWEEGSFNVWKSKIAASVPENDAKMMESKGSPSYTQYLACVEMECLPLLVSLQRICIYIGALTMLLVQPMPRFALALLFSSKWANDEATAVLRCFCLYLPLMGVNGLLEAFLRATAMPKTFARMQQLMVGTSIVSIVVTLLFVKFLSLGVVGLISASVVNVCIRIGVNLFLMGSYVPHGRRNVASLAASLAPLLMIVVAVNLVLYGLGGLEVKEVSVKGLVTAATLGVSAMACVAPVAYRVEKQSENSVIFRK